MKRIALTVLLVLFAHVLARADESSRLPDSSLNLRLAAPISTWDEAIPLGNGTMGLLLWGEGNTLRLSLDRGDLWDERPSPKHLAVKDRFTWASMQRMVAEDRMDEFNEVFDSNYDYDGSPTKLPAGRVEVVLDPSQSLESFELNLATAEGLGRFTTGQPLRVFVSAASVDEPVALILIPGPEPGEVRLKTPDSVAKLGYVPPRTGSAEGLRWFEQQTEDGFAYAVCAAWQRVGDATLLAVTVTKCGAGEDSQAAAQARVAAALQASYEQQLEPHKQWWAGFWQRSQVTVPEPHILQQYYLVRYFYGAASRRGAPPMPLQGVWSADAGSLPPWKGDYHNDLNTQMTYMGYQAAGHFDEGATFLDMLWDLLPTFRQFAQDFYQAPGAAVPGVMSLKGQALGGWGQYSLSPTMGAWNAHLFYLHWRYTRDEQFLRERAYPWCREIGQCLLHLLQPDERGVLALPLSSSPEIFDNTRRAFLIPNTNYDLMSLRMLFRSLAEMAEAMGESADAQRWREADDQLGDWHVAEDGTLLLDQQTPLPGSHRHLSNLMGLYPFNLITVEGGERDAEIIAASLRQWDAMGTSAWCGYSFSWMAALRARVGEAESALRNLDIFTRAFILRNGFHANGDQTKSGYSSMTYRPFTLEGNFLVMAALHEMLLQSWSAAPGTNDAGCLRVFPAMPWRWHEASFADLRSEGGHRVSARRENNATTWLRVVAAETGVVRIRDIFGGRVPHWNRADVRKVGDDFEVSLQVGEVLEATLARPDEIPAPPDHAARTATPPAPSGPVPSERQLAWHELELYGFVHFTVNTFTDREWGYGDEQPSVFQPTEFDADQIVRACKAGGLKGIILTAKHHDGFCLWPSRYTEHSVKNSPWRDGKGDVVRDFADACQKHGLKFGIYISPWDRNHAEYGRPGYVEYYKNQIRELLTNYGPIFEMWFDGASGGDGYYGGQGGQRKIDYNTYYDWKNVRAIIRELQPQCAIWCGQYREGDRLIWADCRWGGSEGGDVGDPCWNAMSSHKVDVGIPDYQHGDREGDVWCPAEGDVSIRPGWFYHASQDGQVKSPEQLMNIYVSCVGRGGNLILNVPPDQRGLVHEHDVKALQAFGQILADTFGADLARSGQAKANNVRGGDSFFGPRNLLDGRRETYWATDDDVTTGDVVLEFDEPVTFNIVRMREYLPLGQRIDDWALDVWQDDAWQEFANGSAIGACRLVRGEPRTTSKLRLRVTKAVACPAMAELALFLEPARRAR